tara:strand:+ start:297 stop:1268 length:972 start_codon:yes stop_codon:yes gene_type:complete
MIIVTGGAGFIGSNYVKFLNQLGFDDIIVVDNFSNGYKLNNIFDARIVDIVQKEDLFDSEWLNNSKSNISKIIHLGACSSTQEWNGRYLLSNNYEYSKKLFNFSLKNNIDFIYASSASVYGDGAKGFKENLRILKTKNAYAYSKYLFDEYVLRQTCKVSLSSQVVGLRFFNVYGPGEFFKGDMSSPIYKFYNQIKNEGFCKVFDSYDGYEKGQHLRDFIHVDDCCKVINFLSSNVTKKRIFNVGTSSPSSFLKVAKSIINAMNLTEDSIKFIPFPEKLKGNYQSYTCADLTNLNEANYNDSFINITEGVTSYIKFLSNSESFT